MCDFLESTYSSTAVVAIMEGNIRVIAMTDENMSGAVGSSLLCSVFWSVIYSVQIFL